MVSHRRTTARRNVPVALIGVGIVLVAAFIAAIAIPSVSSDRGKFAPIASPIGAPQTPAAKQSERCVERHQFCVTWPTSGPVTYEFKDGHDFVDPRADVYHNYQQVAGGTFYNVDVFNYFDVRVSWDYLIREVTRMCASGLEHYRWGRPATRWIDCVLADGRVMIGVLARKGSRAFFASTTGARPSLPWESFSWNRSNDAAVLNFPPSFQFKT